MKLAIFKWIALWGCLTAQTISTQPIFAQTVAVERSAKLNVVLILIDDLSHYGVTAYGANRISSKEGFFENVEFATPRIDSLARDGLRCDDAFAYPLCENTRIALMSGMNNIRNLLRVKSQHASDITFGDVFHRAGYKTCITGKWKQTRGTKEIPGKDYIFEFGWDEFCCFDVVGERRRYIEPDLVVNGKITQCEGIDPETGRRWYGPDLFNRFALDFIDRNQDEPFLLYYPMVLVHDQHTPTPDSQPPSAYDEFDIDNPSEFGHNPGDDRRYFPDMLAYMDKMIGNVLDKLDELGLRDNTLVIVMGDNGTKECFQHVLPDGKIYDGGKGSNTDNGLHVPLLMRGPMIPAGSIYAGLVNLTDIYPTMCEAVGIPVPNAENIDGVSFWRQATGRSTSDHRSSIYTWFNGNRPATEQEHLIEYAFTKDFKRYSPDADFPDGRFFDLRLDPLETGGDRKVKLKNAWNKWHHSGLNSKTLTAEQLAAFEQLGTVLDNHRYVPVEQLKIVGPDSRLTPGQSQEITCQVLPANASRRNVIWESSNPDIATVDKFGEVSAHKPGTANITAYSWDDANPTASQAKQTYTREGIQDSTTINVE